jgi:hypothetical protein
MGNIPPPGPNAAGLLIPQWFLVGASFLVIVARLNLRLRLQGVQLMLSDYFMCCAWLCAVVTASFDIIFARMGVLDPDMDYFLTRYEGPPEDIEYILKVSAASPGRWKYHDNNAIRPQLLWSSQFPFYLTFYFAKAALLAMYLRLFPEFMRKRRFMLWVVVGYCAAAFLVTILATALICRPVEGNW